MIETAVRVGLLEKTCLIVLPLRTGMVRKIIIQILKSLQIKPLIAEDLFHPTYSVISKLQETIKKCDFVVADITGANPNILFEMGMCLAYGKPVLILVRKDTTVVPFDLMYDFSVIEYDQTVQGLHKMEIDLKERLSALSLTKKAVSHEYHTIFRSRGFRQMPKAKARKVEETTLLAKDILELPIGYKREISAKFELLISRIFENEGYNVVSAEKKLVGWPVDLVLQSATEPEFLLVECKNRDVVSEDIAKFSELLDNRHLSKGIIVSNGRIAKDAEKRLLRELKTRGVQIIAFDKSDFERVAQGERFAKLFDLKLTKAAISLRLGK
jgi:hypothetical protein